MDTAIANRNTGGTRKPAAFDCTCRIKSKTGEAGSCFYGIDATWLIKSKTCRRTRRIFGIKKPGPELCATGLMTTKGLKILERIKRILAAISINTRRDIRFWAGATMYKRSGHRVGQRR